MLIDFTKPLIDVRENEPLVVDRAIKFSTELKQVSFTLQMAAGDALSAYLSGDDTLNSEQKLKIGKLIERIYLTPQCEVDPDELALIKERCHKCYTPLVLIALENALK